MLTAATGITYVISAHWYCAFTGLVPPRSQKLGPSYLKTEAHRAISNLVIGVKVRVSRQRL
jgi:hypothetical protein